MVPVRSLNHPRLFSVVRIVPKISLGLLYVGDSVRVSSMAGNEVKLLGGLFLGSVSTGNENFLPVTGNVHGCKSSGAKKFIERRS